MDSTHWGVLAIVVAAAIGVVLGIVFWEAIVVALAVIGFAVLLRGIVRRW